MALFDQNTKLFNHTGQLITFDVERGMCPLRDLPPGGSQSVSLSLIRKLCRERGSPDWPIRTLFNGLFHGIRLHPRHHILLMTRIVFRYAWGPDGSCVVVAEGVKETFVDRIFPACAKFGKRIYTEIAAADLRLRIDGSFQEPPRVAVEPLVVDGNNQPSREVEEPHTEVTAPHSARWRVIIDAIPSQKKRIVRLWDGGRTLASVINSGKKLNATVERQKRAYLRRRNEFILLLLFALSFFVVASLHLATSSTELP